MNYSKRKKETGFTLIELLIVIGIITILAGITVIAINPGEQLAKARNNQRRAHVDAIYGTLEQYVFQNNDLPDCFDGKADDEEFDAYDGEVYLTPDYLNEVPRDPTEGDVTETGYLVKKDANDEIGVGAAYGELEEEIVAGEW